MVEVVGVMVAVPAPIEQTSLYQPTAKLPPEPACGSVTAIAAALLKLFSVPQSALAIVYVVPARRFGTSAAKIVPVAVIGDPPDEVPHPADTDVTVPRPQAAAFFTRLFEPSRPMQATWVPTVAPE